MPAGRRLGGFTIERELGAGGMGMVVLARQESLDRLAVLKRIHPQFGGDAELEARFEREAIAAARLHHPNVVSVYDRFQVRGHHYMATEYVDGVDLAALLQAEAPLPWRIAATIALEVARGLEAIHAQGTLHRDIKPHNLLIGRHGEVKITDFGLALDTSGSTLTQPGIALGTPPYMAPEQLRGERLDPRADLFAFGCVLYEMLTSRPPFEVPQDEASDSMLARVESGRYARVRSTARDAPGSLIRLVRQCLKPRTQRRIGSAIEVRRRLEAILDRPSSGDCQRALSAFLWGRRVFEARETETVVMVACSPAGASRRIVRRTFAAAALTLSVILLGWAVLRPQEVLRWTDAVAGRTLLGENPAEPHSNESFLATFDRSRSERTEPPRDSLSR
jgi:serine/threonine protein kinase